MAKNDEKIYEAEGFEPYTNEQREILKSRIKMDSKDSIVDGIMDKAFSSQEKTETPPPEIKVEPEPQIESEPRATTWTSVNPNPQPAAKTDNRPQIRVQEKRNRIRISLNRIWVFARNIWAKRSIRYVFYMLIALMLGLYIGWMLIPEPPPIIL